jgi:hypothetical protein
MKPRRLGDTISVIGESHKEKRERGRKKILVSNSPNLKNFSKGHECTCPRNSTNSKLDKTKAIYRET